MPGGGILRTFGQRREKGYSFPQFAQTRYFGRRLFVR